MTAEPILFIQDLAVILVAAVVFGYLCRQVGLSPVVGYLSAGLLIGTPDITVPYVTDAHRLEIIAQLGVVFLMFSIGLQFRLRKVKELGFPIVLATALTAILLLTATRGVGDLLGLSIAGGLCLAAVFMNSSSAIIGKVIEERGLGHERYGQVALGITLMEDIVSVVMLAVLGSFLLADVAMPSRHPLETMAMLIGFAVVVLFLGLVIVPGLLRRIGKKGPSELMTIFVAGALLALALIAVRAGYSLALGAFLFGMIVAETRQRAVIERSFRGLKEVFLTVFFVTIGMMIDVSTIPSALIWIALGSVGALFGRSAAAFLSLVVVGERPRQALQTALCITPIGEFSFIIAGLAVASGVLPETFQVAVVGTALITSMVSPLLAANAPKLTAFLAEGKFPRMDRWQHQYAELWKWGGSSGSSSRLWGVLRKRLLQILRETVVVLTIVVFADPIYGAVMESFIGSDLAGRTEVVATYWVLIGLVCLVPIVAVWRNLSAVSMILEDYSKSAKDKTRSRLIPLIGILLRVGFLLLLGLWIWNLLPSDAPRMWILPIVLLVGTAVVVLGWRRMVRWHSQMEVAINESLSASETAGARRLFEDHKEAGWALNIEEVTLPDETTFGGRLLREINLRELTGCSVVGIDRQGYPLRVIRPDNQVFPGDRLMLLGRREQVAAARRLLSDSVGETFAHSEQKDFVLESIVVQPDDALAGKALRDLDWPRRFHVQVVALRRKESVIMPPDGTTCIEDGDTLLLLGRPDMIAKIASEVQGA